ncbi:protein Mis18-alpha [Gouania willdenowi]|uniref:Protein Mis18-alpha n=1 Tax=Gouania willdenowi TaxID=441366 RepID=A0A8C5GN64_GOUWI|nr:protein Mis18-alpha [Gouania willdenowi]
MATKQKMVKHKTKDTNVTFNASSLNSSVIEKKLFAEREEDGDDGPVVFYCGKCRLTVGDSLSWDGSEDGENQIRLKTVTDNVQFGNESHVYEVNKLSPCLVVDLFCRGCRSVIGLVYTSTPKSMDNKRFTFCLNVANIESYVLGSGTQMLTVEGLKELPVTLEYRGSVDQQLKEMKMLMVSMAQRLEVIEAGLEERSDEV